MLDDTLVALMAQDAEAIRERHSTEGRTDGRPSPTSGQKLNQQRRNAARVRLLSALATGAHSYGQIMVATGACHSTISNAVSALVSSGLARSRMRGMKCHVEITDAGINWLENNSPEAEDTP